MYAQMEKTKEDKSKAVANLVAQKKSDVKQGFGFVDNRPEAIQMKQVLTAASNSTKVKAYKGPMPKGLVQRKQTHAVKFIIEKGLGITADKVAISAYVNNKDKDQAMRRGLLAAWNRGQAGPNLIATPVDLVPISTDMTATDDLGAWSSDKEDELDIAETAENKSTEHYDLVRTDGRSVSDVPHVPIMDAIRLGRQANKRDQYQHLPFVTSIGGHLVEMNNPGTKDIYMTPLQEDDAVPGPAPVSTGGEKASRVKKISNKRLRRSGTSSDYNFRNLAKRLSLRYETEEERRKAMGTLFNFYQKKGKYEITPEITEALAAIAADLMKGSVGGRHWIKIAQNAVDTAEKAPSFQQMFTGSNPLYVPAQSGGRNEVTIAHDAGLLINNNNCLINAIAHAALGRNANITELVTFGAKRVMSDK